MSDKLNEALDRIETTYGELVEIANNIIGPIVKDTNSLVDKINSTVNSLTVDAIRDYILQLQLKAFEISEIKEKSAMKADLAVALQKEQFAISFNSADGAAAVKDKIALVNTSAETASSVLYNLIANMLKAKVDQVHRLVDALKSILVSRMQETKFMNIGTTNDIPATSGQVYQAPQSFPPRGNTRLTEEF